MEITEEIELPIKSFKITERLLDCLNVVYNESNSIFMFWNKFQIYGYENHNFEDISKVFVPEFTIDRLFNTNNYLVCLDCTGNIHVTSLKFKNAAQKRFRNCFQPREEGIVTCVLYTLETLASLKFNMDTYFFCIHKINTEFQLEKKVALKVDIEQWPLPHTTGNKCLLFTYLLTQEQFERMKDKFDVKYQHWKDIKDSSLILISFDKITVYGCIFNPKMPDEQITLTKLYVNVSEICDIKIIVTDDFYVIIGLTIGTLIKLPLTTSNAVDIIHLNTAISKFITTKCDETIIYTDGNSLWKSEDTLKKGEITFYQFIIKQVKDFIKFGDELICTTYTNLIYTFPIEEETVYFKSPSVGQYCAAEKLLHNSEYFYKIMKELQKDRELSKNIHVEGSYITALALSRRQDIMKKVIKQYVTVFESYEDALKESLTLTLTEKLSSYFDPKSFLLRITLSSIMIHHTFNDVLSNLFGDLKVHINISSGKYFLKTSSIKLSEPLKAVQVLIPLKSKFIGKGNTINVDIKVVTNIPGSLDQKQTIWTVLYKNDVKLTSEHFVKTTRKTNKSYKEIDISIEDSILQSTYRNFRQLFTFTDISKNIAPTEWQLYVKLPSNFKEFVITGMYQYNFSKQKANFYIEELTSDLFMNSIVMLHFEIGDEKVKLDILNYCSRPVLTVMGTNLKITMDIRNFLANIINNDCKNSGEGKEFVNYALYTTLDNLRKNLHESILLENETETQELIDEFHKTVYGNLPL